MTVAEQIYEIVQGLSEKRASEVLTFAKFVFSQEHPVPERPLESEPLEADSMTWAELVDSLAGSWGNDFPTLEEIRSGEGQDMPRESL